MKILLIAGSNRKNATSTKLLRYMARRLSERGLEADAFDLFEMPVPLYSPDAELADTNAVSMLAAAAAADGFVLGTPEYHGSISGTLKNALDYMGADQFGGKPVLAVSSSGGALGVSSLTQLQAIVRNLHGVNCPEWMSLGGDQRRFGTDEAPSEAFVQQRAERALDCLIRMTALLRSEAEGVSG